MKTSHTLLFFSPLLGCLCHVDFSLAVAMFGYRRLRVIFVQSHLDSNF